MGYNHFSAFFKAPCRECQQVLGVSAHLRFRREHGDEPRITGMTVVVQTKYVIVNGDINEAYSWGELGFGGCEH